MNILITGGAGFIGSHLAHYHLSRGDKVWVVDSLVTGTSNKISQFLKNPNFIFSNEDLLTWPKLLEALTWSDTVYHMAALLGMKYVFDHPFKILSNNIHCLEILLNKASIIQKNIKILVASSSCVYGSKETCIENDETCPMLISSGEFFQETYPASKITNEVMSLCYGRYEHLHIVIARFFNIIGPNQTGRYGMVVPTFIDQALSNRPLTVYGDGLQTRSFCNIHDAIEGSIKLLTIPSSKNQVFNIGKSEEISILELAKLIKRLTNSSSEIIHVPYEQAYGIDFKDIMRRKPSIKKMQHFTGFIPSISLETSILEIIKNKKGL